MRRDIRRARDIEAESLSVYYFAIWLRRPESITRGSGYALWQQLIAPRCALMSAMENRVYDMKSVIAERRHDASERRAIMLSWRYDEQSEVEARIREVTFRRL